MTGDLDYFKKMKLKENKTMYSKPELLVIQVEMEQGIAAGSGASGGSGGGGGGGGTGGTGGGPDDPSRNRNLASETETLYL